MWTIRHRGKNCVSNKLSNQYRYLNIYPVYNRGGHHEQRKGAIRIRYILTSWKVEWRRSRGLRNSHRFLRNFKHHNRHLRNDEINSLDRSQLTHRNAQEIHYSSTRIPRDMRFSIRRLLDISENMYRQQQLSEAKVCMDSLAIREIITVYLRHHE